MSDQAILTTYSSAPQIRMALLTAGFNAAVAPSMGKKREGTIASKSTFHRLNHIDKAELDQDIKTTPYRDELLSLPPKKIVDERIKKMKELREKKTVNQN